MKAHINHWYPKDETFFKVLSTAGNIRSEDANKINISNSRLKNYEKDKLIERVTYPSRYNNQQNSNHCYALTQRGKILLKVNMVLKDVKMVMLQSIIARLLKSFVV